MLSSKGCLSFFWIIAVEIDKRIRFRKVLTLEYMLKMKKYSNTEYLVKSWIMIIIGIVGLFVSFFQTIYNALNRGTNNVYVGPTKIIFVLFLLILFFRFLLLGDFWPFLCGKVVSLSSWFSLTENSWSIEFSMVWVESKLSYTWGKYYQFWRYSLYSH